MTTPSKPARLVAVVSLVLSIVFFIVAFLIGRWSGFNAVYALSFLALGAILIWLVLLIQFHQRYLAEQERLDMSAIVTDQRTEKIFRQSSEQAIVFAVAQKRLATLEKWFIPIFSVLIAVYEVAIGLYLIRLAPDSAPTMGKQPLLAAVCMTAVAFVSFLMSRYATGMSNQPDWKPLRAGGSFLFGLAVISFALTIALALVQFRILAVIKVMDYLIPILFILLGIETALNVVFDIYRPRVAGHYDRAAFDSRLLGLINEPGEILHTAAGAIDYQFGFKVSQTWFYKLLGKAIVPLIFFSIISLYLLSCIIVLGPDEQAVVEHFGSPKDAQGQVRVVGPGVSLKYPWPIDIARKYPVKRINEIYIGFVPKTDPVTGEIIREALLWGKDHYKEEYSVLVASRQGAEKIEQGAAPVSMLKANIPVQFRVNDIYAFLYNNDDSQKLLEVICYRELTKFAAGSTVEVDDPAALQNSLLGAGRARAKQVLTENIQAAADGAGLGIQIVFLGIQGIHPPTQVAADYEKVIGAVQQKQALILGAEAQRNRTLTDLAGSVEDANKLYSMVSQSRQSGSQEDSAGLDKAFTEAGGEIFARLRNAQSYAFEKVTLAEATGKRFSSQVKAYHAAKDFYKREQMLAVLEQSLPNIRKYVIIADSNDNQVYIVDLQEKLTPSLYELGGFEENSQK